jgi:hypothetical protein
MLDISVFITGLYCFFGPVVVAALALGTYKWIKFFASGGKKYKNSTSPSEFLALLFWLAVTIYALGAATQFVISLFETGG